MLTYCQVLVVGRKQLPVCTATGRGVIRLVSRELTRGADQSRRTFQNNNSYIQGYIIES